LTRIAAQGITLITAFGPFRQSLLSALLLSLLGKGFAQTAQSITQSFHRFGLTVDGLGKISIAQGLFGPFHGPIRIVQILQSPLTGFCALSGQSATLPVKLLPQGILPIRK
jgi:hypothetical protein